MRKFAILTAAAALVAVMGFAGTAKAATGLGPTEYLCFDTATTAASGDCANKDSPFADLDFTGGYFHLEDFEGGALSTPGVSAAGQGLTFPCNGGNVDSVDEDDGAIDGSGNGGCSIFSTSTGTPAPITAKTTFTFDDNVLGMFPTHVGIVWTDGLGGVFFEALDETGTSIGACTSSGAHTGVSDGFNGDTDEDRFYGCVNDSGISIIEISMTVGQSTGIELDHLQYGKLGATSEVDINIHPTSFPSPVNVCTSGMGASTPVVIWGSDTFDVEEVDLTTLKLGSNGLKTKGMTPNCSIADVGTPDDNATEVPCDGSDMACDGALWVEFTGMAAEDGHNDLTCHFYTAQLTGDVVVVDSTFSLPVTGDACTDGVIDPGTGLYDCSGSGDPMPFDFSDQIKLNKKCLAALP